MLMVCALYFHHTIERTTKSTNQQNIQTSVPKRAQACPSVPKRAQACPRGREGVAEVIGVYLLSRTFFTKE